MRVIDAESAKIALVIDNDKRLLGTLTDGDIRRGLLEGVTFEDPVERVMNPHFHFLHSCDDDSLALEMMRREGLRQVPVLDEEGRVVRLLLLKELVTPAELPNAVVIMAGGKGLRLRPHTEHCPKPMLLVDGKPMLETLIEQCMLNGFRKFYLSVNYLKEQIIDYFGDGGHWGVSIEYLVEDCPLGTAGSLRLLPDSIKHPFLVMNGDVLTRLNPSKLLCFHDEHHAASTMCVREHLITVPFGVVRAQGVDLESFEEKPSYRKMVNAGVYVIDPQLLSLLPPDQPTDMPTLLIQAKQAGYRVAVCPIHEYWIDVGRPESLKQAHEEWNSGALR